MTSESAERARAGPGAHTRDGDARDREPATRLTGLRERASRAHAQTHPSRDHVHCIAPTPGTRRTRLEVERAPGAVF